MKVEKVYCAYFSPTGSSKRLAEAVAGVFTAEYEQIDLTKMENRNKPYHLDKGAVLIASAPVYAGRVQAQAAEAFKRFSAPQCPVVLLAVYGNRHYEDALLEMADIFQSGGFVPAAAGAFVAEHSFSKAIAGGRPDQADIEKAGTFAQQAKEIIEQKDAYTCTLPGNRPYRDGMGKLPFHPETAESCVGCMRCAKRCPMQAIDTLDVKKIDGDKCIKCMACVKGCAVGAKYVDSEPFLTTVSRLESLCAARREPEFFFG